MITLELSDIEKDRLIKVLDRYLSNLRMEIADTDSSFFKKDLKSEKETLNGIYNKLVQTAETLI